MYVGVSNLTKGMLMSDTKPVVVDPSTVPEIKKIFDGKLRINFNESNGITDIVLLSPDSKGSLVITSPSDISAVFVPFESLGL
jgi:hypothetical protein